MVKAIALNKITNADGECTGYKLKDETGQVMEVNCDAIIGAIERGAINISNLSITSDNKLVMIENKVDDIKNSTLSQARREVVQKDIDSGLSKVDRMHSLVKLLNRAREVYEQGTDEIMSNFEYDKLYDELLKLESETGTVLSNSPTQNVGYEVVSELPKETHETPMLSLDKTKDRAALVGWLNGREGVLSWKMDGLTVVLTYEGGKLVKGVTRGNGEVGEIVTPNVMQFANVPRIIPFVGKIVLRGEATITYSKFNEINSKILVDDEKYKNPRNLCSGSVRQFDSSITASRGVQWRCFSIESVEGATIPNNLDEQFKWVTDLGFECVEYEVVTPNNLLEAIERFSNKVESNDTPTDGLVLAYRNRQYGLSLGATNKFPRHSIAFKWKDEEAETQLMDIEWQVGRTGVITPVAVFEPIDLEGSTVEKASLHNLSVLYDTLGQPYVRQKIWVYKANMIIPQISSAEIVENIDFNLIYIPSTCPCCGGETDIKEDDRSGVLTLWCTNPDCSAKGNRLFEHFVSRDAMNIDGISGATLNTLVEYDVITDFASIFHVAEHQDTICSIDGFGFKSFYNMVQAIDKARKVKLSNLIYALGIPNVGLATAKLICKNFDYDLAQTVSANYNQLVSIDGIGDVIAESFTSYFADKDNADAFIRLVKELEIIKEQAVVNTSMAGVTICVTGDVYIFPNRRAVKDIVESLGGKLTGSVSRSTSYLVTNDTTSGSNKNKAAKEYGIPILTEKEFIEKFDIQL